jgi:hypothetical protein
LEQQFAWGIIYTRATSAASIAKAKLETTAFDAHTLRHYHHTKARKERQAESTATLPNPKQGSLDVVIIMYAYHNGIWLWLFKSQRIKSN